MDVPESFFVFQVLLEKDPWTGGEPFEVHLCRTLVGVHLRETQNKALPFLVTGSKIFSSMGIFETILSISYVCGFLSGIFAVLGMQRVLKRPAGDLEEEEVFGFEGETPNQEPVDQELDERPETSTEWVQDESETYFYGLPNSAVFHRVHCQAVRNGLQFKEKVGRFVCCVKCCRIPAKNHSAWYPGDALELETMEGNDRTGIRMFGRLHVHGCAALNSSHKVDFRKACRRCFCQASFNDSTQEAQVRNRAQAHDAQLRLQPVIVWGSD